MSVPDQGQPDPFLHDRSDVQSVREPSVGSDGPDPSELLHSQERLVQRLARICLQGQRLTDLVSDRLGLMESGSINGNVQPVGDEPFNPLGHVRVDGEVDGVYPHFFRPGEAVGNFVDPDDAGCTFYESPLGDTEPDGSQSLKEEHCHSRSDARQLGPALPKHRQRRLSLRR